MKGNSDITATAISDAALICVYLTMTLSKAALKCPPALLPQWARRDRCRGGQAAFLTFLVAERIILAL